jgi:glutamyl-tRNA reductase
MADMRILVLGVSHHTAPVHLREQLDFGRENRLGLALNALARLPDTAEAAVLSTCNRSELYVTCRDARRTSDDLKAFISRFHGVPREAVDPHAYTRQDEAAVGHLLRVAAGLDSLVVGEPQILGQVKDAYAQAAGRQCTGPVLHKLFHWSFATGKRVRSETGIGEGAVSVSYAAVALARKIFGDLSPLSVLVVGAGEMAKLTAVHLRSQDVRHISIAGRTTAQAGMIADRVGGTPIPWEQLEPALAASDIVVSATGAAEPVLSRAVVDRAMHARCQRPLFLIDIAVPRDIDPAAAEIEEVFLYNIDDLQAIVQENVARRAAQIQRAETIVLDETRRFMGWFRSRDAVPTVVALRQKFEAVRQAELKRLETKLAGLSPDARARVDEVTRLIVEKLLLTPTEQLKAQTDEETVRAYADALKSLFALGDETPPSPPPASPAQEADETATESSSPVGPIRVPVNSPVVS